MESFSRYKNVSFLKQEIEKHTLSSTRDDISFIMKRDNQVAGLSFFTKKTNSKISLDFFYHGKRGHTNLDLFYNFPTAVFCSVKQGFNEGNCDIILNLSTPKLSIHQLQRNRVVSKPIFGNCLASIGGTIRSASISTSIALGISHDKSISTLCAFKSSQVEATLVGSVTEDNAQLTASGLHKSGALFCFSADLAQLYAHELQVGMIKDLFRTVRYVEIVEEGKRKQEEIVEKQEKIGTLFASADVLNKSVEVAGTYSFKLGTVAAKASAGIHRSPTIETGVILPRASTFTLRVKESGDIRMEAEFSPRKWLTVHLRSETSATTSFNPINFGWSLDINL